MQEHPCVRILDMNAILFSKSENLSIRTADTKKIKGFIELLHTEI